jgi:outer membrane protein assembly factor BamB
MKISLFALIVFLFVLSGVAISQSSTRWRGPDQSGVYADTNLLDKWPASGPEISWTFEGLGIGYSSPAIANGLIYISGMEGSNGYIYCLSSDGKLQWKAAYGNEFNSSYPGSRATPVISEGFIYMLSGTGELACLNAQNGRPVWRKNIFSEFNGKNIQWGINETVVIHGNKLICTPGGTTNNIIALEKSTGKLIWSGKGKGETSAYCTPLVTKVGSRNLLVTHTENNILGLDADSGELLWSYPHVNRWGVHPNTPLFHNNQLFCFSGYGKGGVLLQLNADGSRVTKKWEAEDLDSRLGGAVVLDGKIYGSGDENRDWQCIDWESGTVKYKTREIGNGVIIAADGKLFFYSQRGELALVKPGGTSFEIASETKVSLGSGQHWAHPVIDQGRLLVRHGNALVAYKILR